MVFSSELFIFCFLPLVCLVFFLLRNRKAQNIWLFITSLVFFSWNQPQYFVLILAYIFVDWLIALIMEKSKVKHILLVIGIFANLCGLIIFKYLGFISDIVYDISAIRIPIRELALPIGISFFTFQGLSYIVDVYRGEVKAQKNLFNFGLYLALFPQLIAGPIVRYKDVEKQIVTRCYSINSIVMGVRRFILGFVYKVLFADTFATTVDFIWNEAGLTNNTVAVVWMGSIAYSLQIYFDFYGYSLMAMGIGKMLGFDFPDNFNNPYISRSISEFWRRWHITLSSWFRDYVYIPLGGNRHNVYRNLLIVFLLTGIWHGAAWQFIIWGLWHAVFILIERMLKDRNTTHHKSWLFLSHIYTLLVVNIGWVLFRADTLRNGILYIQNMFGVNLPAQPGFKIGWYINRWNLVILGLSVITILGLPKKIVDKIKNWMDATVFLILSNGAALIAFILCIVRMVASGYSPFIYFQF